MLLHNSLIRWGFMPIGTEYFSLRNLAEACAFVLLGTANELMGGTLWFVPALCMASVFLSFLVTISRKIEKKTGNSYLKFAFQFVVILVCSIVGCIVISILMPANIQVSLTVMPFFVDRIPAQKLRKRTGAISVCMCSSHPGTSRLFYQFSS